MENGLLGKMGSRAASGQVWGVEEDGEVGGVEWAGLGDLVDVGDRKSPCF